MVSCASPCRLPRHINTLVLVLYGCKDTMIPCAVPKTICYVKYSMNNANNALQQASPCAVPGFLTTCYHGHSAGPSKAIYIPLFIRDADTLQPISSNFPGQEAQIQKLWPGYKKGCCTDADNFHIIYPAGADANTKANLLGSTILIDFAWFESQT